MLRCMHRVIKCGITTFDNFQGGFSPISPNLSKLHRLFHIPLHTYTLLYDSIFGTLSQTSWLDEAVGTGTFNKFLIVVLNKTKHFKLILPTRD